ncbi:MAG: hypothetical protein AAF363_03875 [Bacteroidota bacterium]
MRRLFSFVENGTMLFNKLRRKTFGLTLSLLTVVTFSCSDSEEPQEFAAPILSVNTVPQTINDTVRISAGSSLNIAIGLQAAAGFQNLEVTGIDLSDNIVFNDETISDPNDFENSFSKEIDFDFDDPQLLSSIVNFEITVVDRAGQSDVENLIVVVSSPSVALRSMVLLGAQINSNPSFYDAIGDRKFLFDEARSESVTDSSIVDFAYYFGEGMNSLSAIDDEELNDVFVAANSSFSIENGFTTRNATRFVNVSDNVSSDDFNDIVNGAQLLGAASLAGEGTSRVTNLEVGNVIAFQLADSRAGLFGLVRIVEINDTDGEGTITVDIKIQTLNN